jgi:hypothetical protein
MRRVRVRVERRGRSRRFWWSHDKRGRYLNVVWGSPTVHRWWACSLWLFY